MILIVALMLFVAFVVYWLYSQGKVNELKAFAKSEGNKFREFLSGIRKKPETAGQE